MPKRYQPEFRPRALALLDAGPNVTEVAHDLGIGTHTLFNWRRRALVDAGKRAGLSSVESAESRAARAEIARLRDEVTILRRSHELLKGASSPKETVRGDCTVGNRGATGEDIMPAAVGVHRWVLRVEDPAAVTSIDPSRTTMEHPCRARQRHVRLHRDLPQQTTPSQLDRNAHPIEHENRHTPPHDPSNNPTPENRGNIIVSGIPGQHQVSLVR